MKNKIITLIVGGIFIFGMGVLASPSPCKQYTHDECDRLKVGWTHDQCDTWNQQVKLRCQRFIIPMPWWP